MAWTLVGLGRFDEAREHGDLMVESAMENDRPLAWANRVALESAISRWRKPSGEVPEEREEELLALAKEITRLERDASSRHDWRFAESSDRWWHRQLADLTADLEALADSQHGLFSAGISAEHGWGIARRIEFATALGGRSVVGAEARRRWEEAISSIRDRAECPKYSGLELVPQMGLLPLGRDADSGLWEFAHLASGEPPVRDERGRWIIGEETGLVFVLLPAAIATLGAQSDAPGVNFDPQADPNEKPVHEVELSPFFASKYEMTQGQYRRATGVNPSEFSATSANYGPYDDTHPAERVNWQEAVKVLGWLGLTLPSEAQWEYACRGGTDTPWWTGENRESLRGCVNIADRSARDAGANWPALADWPDFEDGWAVHGPVGSLAANAFGLHDLGGNVAEWCLDGWSSYSAEKRKDPVAEGGSPPQRVIRGGSFDYEASRTRSAFRTHAPPTMTGIDIGLRPVRKISSE